jgi:polyhydroxyalkanoate synthesis repressor PhaR
MGAPLVIKKYPNRRLYHTVERRYINLEDIEALVQADVDFRVLDSATDEDLTRRILVQVILEQMKEFDPIVPVEFLKLLIKQRGSSSTWTDLVQRFFQPGAVRPPSWLDPFGLFGGGGSSTSSPSPAPPAESAPDVAPPAASPGPRPDVDLQSEFARLRAEMDRLAGLVAGTRPGQS